MKAPCTSGVGHSINMLALLITSCVHDKGQTAGERNATWQEWTRAIFSLAGHTPAPELSPPRLFTWPTGERETERRRQRERDGSAASPTLSSSSLSLFDDRDKASEYPQRWGRVINYPVILFITFHLFPLPLLLSAACLSNARRSFKGTFGFS